jgi:hypothetical protein
VSTWGTRTRENSPINGLPNEKTQKVAYTFTGEPIRYTSTLSQNTGTDTFDASSANVKGYISFLAQGNLSGLTTGTSVNYWVHIEAVDNSNVYQESVVQRTFANASTDGLSPTIWKRFTFPFTVADTDARKLRCRFIYETAADGSRSQSGENFWLEVKDVQIEKGVVPTSFIPTTTAEVTRPAETLKYFNLGNSTKDKESIFISFTPRGTGFANDGVLRRLHGTDTKSRIIRGSLGGNVLDFYPNGTDSTSCMTTTSGASGTLNSLTKYATTMKHSSPYVSAYLNGLASGTPETADDFVNPAWGTYFFIGSQFNGTESFQGDISKVAKFSRALSASEVAAVDRFLNQ